MIIGYILAGIAVLLLISFPFFARKLAEKSGWKQLAKNYQTDASRRTVKGIRVPVYTLLLNGFAYQNSVRVIVTKKGLLLGMVWPFSYTHSNLIIPWRAIRGDGQGKSVLGRTRKFAVGQPVTTILEIREKDWEKLRSHVRGKGM